MIRDDACSLARLADDDSVDIFDNVCFIFVMLYLVRVTGTRIVRHTVRALCTWSNHKTENYTEY